MDLEATPKRRRGKDLEDAILRAGWELLLDAGYHGFTIDAVADRAETSRSVLYRRWDDRAALLDAVLTFGLNQGRRDEPEDTGTLRGDMIAALQSANARNSAIAPLLSVFMGEYYAASGQSVADVRARAFGDRAGRSLRIILERAVARGEADPARLTPRVRTVATDLFRHDLLMNARPLTDEQIVEIIDEVFLPLVAPARA
ncbi:TetR/AcrR family transcriptional regulator [Microbacterium fluvii]|uniref:TetR/AcrR family transcriptional regulator n=1 Tax=Microbacterium fluvii TaxID=415215 RepID=A0ABW2HFB2_9MICO|nr:TetR/AcrR family transcriptional regulator [Microbacterium fluvii]MCU4672029.1 TetR/AcrR family transcriptional regulator [Microbacterium fluvii]